MQSLLSTRNRAASQAASEQDCARDLLDVVPLVIRVIRAQMCKHRSGLTIPQFRTLCFLNSGAGNSLSSAADFIGLSLPAMSRLVDGLVEGGLIDRRPASDDRRQVKLSVTPAGKLSVDEARQLAQAHLAEAVAPLSSKQRATIIRAMETLRDVFSAP
jgi:DNA-binding MarR family transcriptional regulator